MLFFNRKNYADKNKMAIDCLMEDIIFRPAEHIMWLCIISLGMRINLPVLTSAVPSLTIFVTLTQKFVILDSQFRFHLIRPNMLF